MGLIYLKLEIKRAWKRFPQLCAGAITLLVMAGVIALVADRALYGEQAAGRVAVGVCLSQEDALARQVMKMVSSLESVGSVCDFQYMDREECLRQLEEGELYAVLDIPEGFVEDIISGANTPVKVWLGEHAGVEGALFRELTDAGALTLSASQAGIYAGNEIYSVLGIQEAIGRLEADLNQRYMDYSLGRAGYFRHMKVQATKDVTTAEYYGVSMYVFFLFLTAIPVSGYLMPYGRVMRQKLKIGGIGAGYQVAARTAAMSSLMLAAGGAVLGAGLLAGGLVWSKVLAGVWVVSCVTAASLTVLVYQAAGNLLGGIMLLFFLATGQHFLAGGFLPPVFLPETMRQIGAWLPSGILMDTVKMAVTGEWDWRCAAGCGGLAAVAWLLGTAVEVRRR